MTNRDYKFVGLSTGRAGSRYLTLLLNKAGVPTVHEVGISSSSHVPPGVLGEVSAHIVTQPELRNSAKVWHFSRHPQPFVSSLIKFRFWEMNAPAIHPYLRRTGDIVADSFLYWVDWNQRILGMYNRTTFRIEDVNCKLIAQLAASIGVAADTDRISPAWNEKQEFAPIPSSVLTEVCVMMEKLGYA